VAVEGSYEDGLEDSNTVISNLEGPSSMPSAKNNGDAKVRRSEEEILDILMFKFDEQIISHLDKRAKEAILKQEEIEEERVFAKVKGAIEGRILDLLLESLTSAPNLKFFMEILSVADPGCLSRIPDPDFYPSRIPDLGSWIQKQQQKRGVKKIFMSCLFM
jgi:hypothetical protein